MKSISISWASGVQDDEAVQCLSAVVSGISSLYYSRWPWGLISPLVGFRTFGSWVIPALPEGSPYSSFDWYVAAAAREDDGVIDYERFLDLVVEEPWQKEAHHFDFSIVDVSLVSAHSSEPAALASRKGVAAVVSVGWVRQNAAAATRNLSLRRLAAQAMGLAYGLDLHGPAGPLCAMRPFSGPAELQMLAEEEWDAGTVYCVDHHRELLSILYNGRAPLN